MRCDPQPGVALGQRRADPQQAAALQHGEITVDEARGRRGCAAAEIALLEQDDPQATAGGITRHAHAVETPADDRKVVVRHLQRIAFSDDARSGHPWRGVRTLLAGLARQFHRVGTANQREILSNWRRSADKKALHCVAAFVGQEIQLFLGFHALRDHRHSEPVTKADHRANDRGGLRIAPEIHHKGAIDLDLVERERLEIAQRRIAAAEIVHGNAHAERLQPPQQREAAVEILDQHALGDFQFEPVRREPGFKQDRMHETDHVAVHELHRRQVDRDL